MKRKCCKCGQSFFYDKKDVWWDFKSGGFDAKLVKCAHCGQVNILGYYIDNFKKRESWYYYYDKKKED